MVSIGRCLAAAGLILTAALVGALSEAPLVRAGHPVLATGYVLIGVGFALTAVLLFGQPEQHGNAWLVCALTGSWVAGQASRRDLGALSAFAFYLGSFTQVLAVALLLRYPGRRSGRIIVWFVRVNTAISAVIGAAEVLAGRPGWANTDLSGWWPNLWANSSVVRAVALVRALWWAAAAAVFIVLLIRRWRRMGAFERRALAPILVAGLAGALTIGIEPALLAASPGLADILETVRAYSGVGLSVAFVMSALQMSLASWAVTDLIPRLSDATTVEGIEQTLQWALADPTLQVVYWVGAENSFVAGDGSRCELPAEDHRRMVVRARSAEGVPVAAVLANAALGRHRALVESVVAVSGIALHNARLQADLRAVGVAVDEVRRRLLRTGIDERSQLERDLHDGAQQRLLGVGLRLGALEAGDLDEVTASAVQQVRRELQLALQELRDLARGIHPAILTEAGLGPALEEVAGRLEVAVAVDIADRRWPAEVESTAYFVVCEALTNTVKHAGARHAGVRVTESDGGLRVEVDDDGRGSATLNDPSSVPHLRNRLTAVGGKLVVTSRPHQGTRILATIPMREGNSDEPREDYLQIPGLLIP